MTRAYMGLLLLGACTGTPVGDCEDAVVTTGAVEDQLLPDGSSLAPWLAALTAGVDVSVQWGADGSSSTLTASVGSYEADAVELTVGDCAVPLLTVDGEASAALDAPALELAGATTVWRAELDEQVSGLTMDLATVTLDAEHEPFPGYDTVDPPLVWTFELFERASSPGVRLAVLRWSTGDDVPVVVDGQSYLSGRLFGTPGDPWTDPDEVAEPTLVP